MKRFSFTNRSFIHFSFFWLTLFLLVGGCSQSTPIDVLTKYLDALYVAKDYKKAMNYVSSEDKPFYEQWIPLLPRKSNPVERYKADRTSFTILSMDISGDQATAEVVIEEPDTLSAPDIFMAASLADIKGESDFEEDFDKLYAENHNGESVPTISYNETFKLIKGEDGWKVYLDLKSKKVKQFMGMTIPPI